MAEGAGISLGELADQRGISKDAARRLVKAGTDAPVRLLAHLSPLWPRALLVVILLAAAVVGWPTGR